MGISVSASKHTIEEWLKKKGITLMDLVNAYNELAELKEKTEEIKHYIKTVKTKNEDYIERNIRVVDLSDLIIKTEIKAQNEMIRHLLKLLEKEQ